MQWTDGSGRLELSITLAEAKSGSHQGDCEDDILALRKIPKIARQLAKWDPKDVRTALKETGAWDDSELADDDLNLTRMLWLACCDIAEASKR